MSRHDEVPLDERMDDVEGEAIGWDEAMAFVAARKLREAMAEGDAEDAAEQVPDRVNRPQGRTEEL